MEGKGGGALPRAGQAPWLQMHVEGMRHFAGFDVKLVDGY
jgi:hypothetical protein